MDDALTGSSQFLHIRVGDTLNSRRLQGVRKVHKR